ncbi:MAG: hypothetical protein IT223_11295 [Crocinitomicaceae bacterium]|nr:hypothetical protein [Crocinitomicaceae bacterium]
MRKNIIHTTLLGVTTLLLTLWTQCAYSQNPTIYIDSEEVLTSNMSSGSPYWLGAGQTLEAGNLVKFISVLEYTIVPAGGGGNSLQFFGVLSVSTVQTVPSGKAWKIESVAMDPAASVFGGADNLGNHVATNHLTMSNFRIDGVGNPTAAADAVNVATQQSGNLTYSSDGGTANAYTVNLSIAPAAYTTGMVINFKASNTNTGASTLNVNSLGAKSIRKQGGGTDVSAGDIAAGQMVTAIYDGTYFQITGQLGNPAGGTPHGKQRLTSSGTFTVPAGVYTVYLTMCGGGGSGGGFVGSGGGGAATVLSYPISVTPAENITVTIGTGGSSVTGNVNGNSGGTSSFGSYFSTGGGGGGTYSSGAVGAGGTGSSGSVPGGNGTKVGGNTGGNGGGALYGMGGIGGYDQNGTNGVGYGSGGAGGGANCCQSSGAGAAGIAIIEW